MITLLIYIVVLLIVFGVLFYVIDLLPIGPPNIRMAAKAILALILVLILLSMVFGGLRFPPLTGGVLQ